MDAWAGGGCLDGDLVAEAFQAADIVAGLAADVHALFVVVGALLQLGLPAAVGCPLGWPNRPARVSVSEPIYATPPPGFS